MLQLIYVNSSFIITHLVTKINILRCLDAEIGGRWKSVVAILFTGTKSAMALFLQIFGRPFFNIEPTFKAAFCKVHDSEGFLSYHLISYRE